MRRPLDPPHEKRQLPPKLADSLDVRGAGFRLEARWILLGNPQHEVARSERGARRSVGAKEIGRSDQSTHLFLAILGCSGRKLQTCSDHGTPCYHTHTMDIFRNLSQWALVAAVFLLTLVVVINLRIIVAWLYFKVEAAKKMGPVSLLLVAWFGALIGVILTAACAPAKSAIATTCTVLDSGNPLIGELCLTAEEIASTIGHVKASRTARAQFTGAARGPVDICEVKP